MRPILASINQETIVLFSAITPFSDRWSASIVLVAVIFSILDR